MSEERDFDEIFRSKLDEQQFPFDESNWDAAELLIEKQRKKEKRRRFFFIYFIGIITGISIMSPIFYLINKSDSNQNTELAVNESEHDGVVDNEIIGTQENTKSIENDEKIIHSDDSAKSTSIESVIINDTKQNTASTNNGLNTNKNSTNENKSNFSSENNNQSDSNSATQLIDHSNQDTKKNGTTSNNLNAENHNSPNSGIDHVKIDSIVDDNLILPLKENIFDTTAVALYDAIEDSLTEKNSENELIKDSTQLISENDTSIEDNEEISSLPFIKERSLLLHIGGVYNHFWKYNDTLDGLSVSPTFGLTIYSHFIQNFSYSIGLFYQFRGNMNYNFKEVKASSPSFGKNDSVFNYSVKRLHYLVLPASIYYHINEKNSVGFGGSFSYLISSISTLNVYNETNFGKTLLSSDKSINFLEGFNRFDASLNLSYRRKIGVRMNFTTDINFGLFDQKSNSYFTNSSTYFERNIYVRATLAIKLSDL